MLRNCKYIKSISIKTFSVKANIEFQGEKFRQHLSIQKKVAVTGPPLSFMVFVNYLTSTFRFAQQLCARQCFIKQTYKSLLLLNQHFLSFNYAVSINCNNDVDTFNRSRYSSTSRCEVSYRNYFCTLNNEVFDRCLKVVVYLSQVPL